MYRILILFCSMQREIGLLTTQLRGIEKRMLRATRERNARSLNSSGLTMLLEYTYDALFAKLDEFQVAKTVILFFTHMFIMLQNFNTGIVFEIVRVIKCSSFFSMCILKINFTYAVYYTNFFIFRLNGCIFIFV